ncbi:MAG: hypothetical protein QME64_12585, partial [bacterium]|nr:hypothetical protein [bacterium]
GTRTVYGVFQDPAGNISSEVNDTIILIATAELRVESSPETGAYITVSPTDNNDNSSGYTNFIRNYDQGTDVYLTAPSSYNGKPFAKWSKDGSDFSTNTSIIVPMDNNHTLVAEYQLSPMNSYGEFTANSDTTHWYFEKYGDASSAGALGVNTTYGFAAIYQIPGQKAKISQVFSVPSSGWYTAKASVLTDISDISKQQKVYLYLQELGAGNTITGCANQVIYPGNGGLGSAWTWKDLEIFYFATGTVLAVQVVGINDASSGVNGSLVIDYIWVYAEAANPTETIALYNPSFDLGSTYWWLEKYGNATYPGIWTTAWSNLILSQDSGMKGQASQWFSVPSIGKRVSGKLHLLSGNIIPGKTQKVYLYIYDCDSTYTKIIASGNGIFYPNKWADNTWQDLQFIYNPSTKYNVVQLVGINPNSGWDALYFDWVELKQE